MASSDPPKRRLGHVPALDGVRGYAVLIVMISHVHVLIPKDDVTGLGPLDAWINGGYLGVDIFFVLSGFLITALLLQENDRNGQVFFGRFYGRRALRLLPALYFMLLCHATYTLLTDQPWGPERESIKAAVLYYFNWLIVTDLNDVVAGLNHLWSLAVEEQFYVIWPAVLVGLLTLGRKAVIAGVIAGGIVLVAVHRTRLWEDGTTWLELVVRTDTRADGLLIGALLAFLWRYGLTPRRGVDIAAWLALGGLVVYQCTVDANSGFAQTIGTTLFATLVAVILLAILQGTWAPVRVIGHPWLRAVGVVSYGLYLWHFPVFYAVARYGGTWNEVVRAAVGLALAAAFTLLSWYGLERPLQPVRGRLQAPVPAHRPVLETAAS